MKSILLKQFEPPFGIVGMGLSGRATLHLLLDCGVARDQILTFDAKSTDAEFSDPGKFIQQGLACLFVSPGVPLSTPWIKTAQKNQVRISSELELAFSFLQGERVIAITGSIGKSTTTALLGAGLKSFSQSGFVGGNIGQPLASYASQVLTVGRPRADWVILELSSYQLENFNNLVCDFSAITFLTPNHLERYTDLESYYRVKLGLISRTKGLCVLNKNGGDLVTQGIPSGRTCWVDRSSELVQSARPFQLVGDYNLDNFAVAAELSHLAQWPKLALSAMKSFAGLPHRLENLGVIDGVRFINDSKATTIESVSQATETLLRETSPTDSLVLLLGGHDKNLPWTLLKRFQKNANLQPIFFGEFGEQARNITGLNGVYFKTLKELLLELPRLLQSGDTVLLSPGGTSHDEFSNFEERGNVFKDFVLRFRRQEKN